MKMILVVKGILGYHSGDYPELNDLYAPLTGSKTPEITRPLHDSGFLAPVGSHGIL